MINLGGGWGVLKGVGWMATHSVELNTGRFCQVPFHVPYFYGGILTEIKFGNEKTSTAHRIFKNFYEFPCKDFSPKFGHLQDTQTLSHVNMAKTLLSVFL